MSVLDSHEDIFSHTILNSSKSNYVHIGRISVRSCKWLLIYFSTPKFQIIFYWHFIANKSIITMSLTEAWFVIFYKVHPLWWYKPWHVSNQYLINILFMWFEHLTKLHILYTVYQLRVLSFHNAFLNKIRKAKYSTGGISSFVHVEFSDTEVWELWEILNAKPMRNIIVLQL